MLNIVMGVSYFPVEIIYQLYCDFTDQTVVTEGDTSVQQSPVSLRTNLSSFSQLSYQHLEGC